MRKFSGSEKFLTGNFRPQKNLSAKKLGEKIFNAKKLVQKKFIFARYTWFVSL